MMMLNRIVDPGNWLVKVSTKFDDHSIYF